MKVLFLKDFEGYEQGDIVELAEQEAKILIKERVVEPVQEPQVQEAPKRGRAK